MKLRARLLLVYVLSGILLMTCAGCRRSEKTGGQQPQTQGTDAPVSQKGADSTGDALPTQDAPLSLEDGMEKKVGVLLRGEIRAMELLLTNTSEKELVVDGIEATCACTHVLGIVNGLKLAPHEIWKLQIRLDSTKIDLGAFTRNVIIPCKGYKPFILKFSGEVQQFVNIKPETATMTFPAVRRPDAPWSAECFISGREDLEQTLGLSLDPSSAHKNLEIRLEKAMPGKWQITVKPKGALPWGRGSFAHTLKLNSIDEKTGKKLPDISVKVKGKICTNMQFYPRMVSLDETSFSQEGKAEFTVTLGFDPYSDTTTSKNQVKIKNIKKMQESMVSDVDWEAFHANFAVPSIPGVEIVKEDLRFGVQMKIAVSREAFDEKGRLNIVPMCFGQPLPEIRVAIKKGDK